MINTVQMLKEQYVHYSNPLDKIKREVDCGNLFRLNRGLYETNKNVDPLFLAAHILPQSYLSFEFALSYYGLIPERVVTITSATLNERKNKIYVNDFGRFSYSDIPLNAYPYGIAYIDNGEYYSKIATKEKAICDCLYKWRKVDSVRELKELMFEDKRIYEEEFSTCDFDELIKIAKLYRKKNLNLLIKLIMKEYRHE